MSNLSNARAQLEEWEAKKPEDYTSKYKDRIDGVMGQLDGMKDFSYDPTRDAAYEQYKNSYTARKAKGRLPGAGLDDADKVPQAAFNSVSAVSKIKCAAGTLRAYLRRRTDDAKASFVSSRSLAARGPWGTAPSVFCLLLHEQK